MGKTEVSIQIAKEIEGEIVIADSVQVYRYLDIGSGKPSPEERKEVPHHLLDIVDPDKEFDAHDYVERARPVIKEISERGKIPIICGGCGFYIRQLLRGEFPAPPRDDKIREELRKEGEEKGWETLFQELLRVDPEYAGKIHPHDKVRIIRALEVYRITKRPLSSFTPYSSSFFYSPLLFLVLVRPREELYKRIEERVEKMWEKGWVEEVRGLLEKGFPPDSPGLQSLGYAEIVELLQGKLRVEEAKEVIKKRTRKYAKRQITWFRREEAYWITLKEEKGKMKELIRKFILNL